MRIVMAFFMLTLLISGAAAQTETDTVTFKYGDTISGALTEDTPEVEYTFSGEANDIIIIEEFPEDIFDGLNNTALVLTDSDGVVRASIDGGYGANALIYQLDSSSPYTLTIRQHDEGYEDSRYGDFSVSLNLLPTLEIGESIQSELETGNVQYYGVLSSQVFTLTYQRESGNFAPEVTVNFVGDPPYGNDNLENITRMSGEGLYYGQAQIDPSRYNQELFIIRLEENFYDYALGEESAVYTLEISS